MYQGSCLCGRVSYEFDGPISLMMNCHCSMCRKHHGSAYATFLGAPLSGFRWLSGEDNVRSFASSSQGKRFFCATCGSVAPTLLKAMELALVPAGNVSGEVDAQPQYHVFVGSKAPWYAITDALPQHEEYPPEFGASGLERPRVQGRPGVTFGSCLCGDVAFEIEAAPLRMANCYCSRCRRARSAAHATNLFYPLSAVRYVRGEERVVDYQFPEAKYFGVAFCERCGSKVARRSIARGAAVVPGGSLDTDPGVRADMHICVASKANWVQINDSVQQFAEVPPPAAVGAPPQPQPR
jgi:hypothetical protein